MGTADLPSAEADVVSLEVLNSLFDRTLSNSATVVAEAEQRLLQLVPNGANTTFIELLLHYQVYPTASYECKLAGAIFFKNLLKRYWKVEGDSETGTVTPFTTSSRDFIKTNLLTLVLSVTSDSSDDSLPLYCFDFTSTAANPNVKARRQQRQLRMVLYEALSIIAEEHFPLRWPSLLPQLVGVMGAAPPFPIPPNKTEEPNVVTRLTQYMLLKHHCLSLLALLTLKYKTSRPLNNETALELKTIADGVVGTLVTVLGQLCVGIQFMNDLKPIPKGTSSTSDSLEGYWDHFLFLVVRCLQYSITIIINISALEVIEVVEDNLRPILYVAAICSCLKAKLSGYTKTFDIIDDKYEGEPGALEELRVEGLELLTLFSDRYQEQLEPFVSPAIEATWAILSLVGPEAKEDTVAIAAIRFLTSVCQTRWTYEGGVDPFSLGETMLRICSLAVVPNVYLRDSDIETMEDNPIEYVRKDLEGFDKFSRRAAAIGLVKGLCKFYKQQVAEVLWGYIGRMCSDSRSSADVQSQRLKDAAAVLVTGLSKYHNSNVSTSVIVGNGTCGSNGVHNGDKNSTFSTTSGSLIITKFLNEWLVEEVRAMPLDSRPIAKAAALKFITTFRVFLDQPALSSLFPLVLSHVESPNCVVHSYACFAVEKLLTVKEPINANTTVSTKNARTKLKPEDLAPALKLVVMPLVELMRSNRGIRENEYVIRAITRVLVFLKQYAGDSVLLLRELIEVVKIISNNPTNPVYNHHVFEAIAAIIQFTNTPIAETENTLVPVLCTLIKQGVHDFIPYSFQVLGLLLEKSTAPSDQFTQIFHFLMSKQCWNQANANVPGMVRLLGTYFKRNELYGALLQQNIEPIFERFQFCLHHAKLSTTCAFDFLNIIFSFVPFVLYKLHFQTLITVLLARLKSHGSESLKQNIVVSLSLFVCKAPEGERVLVEALEAIQPGLTLNFFLHVFLKIATDISNVYEKKVVVIALLKLTALPIYNKETQLFNATLRKLSEVLGWVDAIDHDSGDSLEPEIESEQPLNKEFEITYCRLVIADTQNKDLVAEIKDVHALVCSSLRGVSGKLQEAAKTDERILPLLKYL